MSQFIRNHRHVRALHPFVVVTDFNRGRIDMAPFGVSIPESNCIDPTRLDNEEFTSLLQRLDGRTFGPEGMPMDRWVFYDCCFIPGAIFGFARTAGELSEHAREVLEVADDYEGLVPYSMYIGIPMAPAGAWMGHNLASIGPTLPEENLKGLGSLTKAMGLKSFGTVDFYGATQWSSLALYIHVKFGPLDLLTAYTPAHSEAQTLTYGFRCTEQALLSAAGAPGQEFDRPEPDFWIDAADTAAMIALQDRIEAGETFVIPSAPRRDATGIRVPVAALA